MKNTKRALLTSVIALVMCITMLVGTTFAWFTDSAMSLNNKIVAGELDVELRMYNKTTGEYENIGDSFLPIFGDEDSLIAQNENIDTLWEPGKTQVAYLQIVNHGTLALKYKVAIEVRNDENDLYEVMEYDIIENATPDSVTEWNYDEGLPVVVGTNVDRTDVRLEKEAVHNFALAIHMLEEAGNKYQFGEVSFDIKVLATQDTVEADYFDEFYDKDATYLAPVKDAVEVVAALGNGDGVKFTDNINVAEPSYDEQGYKAAVMLDSGIIDGSDYELTSSGSAYSVIWAQDEAIGVKNVTVDTDLINAIYAEDIVNNFVVENNTLTAEGNGIHIERVKKAILKDNTITANASENWGAAVFAGDAANVVIESGTYTGANYALYTGGSAKSTITVNGGTFEGAIATNGTDEIIINGGTFTVNPEGIANVTVNGAVTDNGDGTYTVA